MSQHPHTGSSGRARPDAGRLEACLGRPEHGPRILFFSGGTALNGLCRELVRFTHRSVHLVTPFDSGGSSARLRREFGIFAVGDTRNRLAALADPAPPGNSEALGLFRHRLPGEASPEDLRRALDRILGGEDPLSAALPPAHRSALLAPIARFLAAASPGFDLRGASLGNLVLVGGFLGLEERFGPMLARLGNLLGARGRVWPIVTDNLHLAAELADGRLVLGQHRMTAKECPPLDAPIRALMLSASLERFVPAACSIRPEIARRIQEADLICYPMGSFFTSLLANLLPEGVGEAVSRNPCPKVYIPNAGPDPESLGIDLAGSVELLLAQLRRGPAGGRLLDELLLDEERPEAEDGEFLARMARLGIAVARLPLSTPESRPFLDGRLLAEALAGCYPKRPEM